tara:strand:+ start:4231 stop:4629 length:399 start_codon:yes stop_codon:yes gene_type:complete
MATDKRTFPNTYFAWYNDDNRVAIVCQDTTSVSGESTQEKYDSYQGADVATGLRITYSSKFETADAQTDNLKSDIGLDSGLHPALVCYIKSRIFEDMGDLEKAQYFRNMYEKSMKQYPTKKSGVRTLSVPRL